MQCLDNRAAVSLSILKHRCAAFDHSVRRNGTFPFDVSGFAKFQCIGVVWFFEKRAFNLKVSAEKKPVVIGLPAEPDDRIRQNIDCSIPELVAIMVQSKYPNCL